VKQLRGGSRSKLRESYMMELLAERLTHDQMWHHVNEAMQWGVDYEPIARSEYESVKGVEVEQIGLATHPRIRGFAASTDGLVGRDGMVEIKCPQPPSHTKIVLQKAIPEAYLWQMMGGMACAERQWCDFVSFNPKMQDKELQLYIRRINRDDKLISAIECEVEQFLQELNELETTVRNEYRTAVAV